MRALARFIGDVRRWFARVFDAWANRGWLKRRERRRHERARRSADELLRGRNR